VNIRAVRNSRSIRGTFMRDDSMARARVSAVGLLHEHPETREAIDRALRDPGNQRHWQELHEQRDRAAQKGRGR
jgi:hypothetical protein